MDHYSWIVAYGSSLMGGRSWVVAHGSSDREPAGSARQPLRTALLRYFDDISKAMQIEADMADHTVARSADAKDERKRLLDEAKRLELSIR